MPASATTLALSLKEVWTDDTLQKQFDIDDGPLTRLESTKSTMIGSLASVPVGTDISAGGFISTSSTGGALAAPTNQPVNKAQYTLNQLAFSIGLEFSALNQANGSDLASVVDAKDMEITYGLESLRNQATRMACTNGDSIVAACASGGASTTVSLVASPSATAWGFDAIVREWLRPGMVVDIGTTADTDSLVGSTTITAVSEAASAPTITIGSSITTVAGTHFVFVQNPNSATAANPELNGFRNIIGTGAIGGLDPTVAGQENWKAAQRDTSTSVLSLDLCLSLARSVKQKTKNKNTSVWSGLKQESAFYSLLQNQVRFASDSSQAAGDWQTPTWNGLQWEGFPAILDSDLYFLTLKDIFRIVGAGYPKPTWMSNIMGVNTGLAWNVRTTNFEDAVVYALQLGVKRRNSHAAATALTA